MLVFAKAPIPGHCKTRLARGCSARRAARIYRALVEHAIIALCAHAAARRVCLLCAPTTRHPFFKRLARDYGVALRRQVHGDLGQRMHAALVGALRRHRSAVLIGSDQPILQDGWLVAAGNALAGNDRLWLAPTTDGGYWAIGLTQPAARLFRGPAWSTPRVARATRRRASQCGLNITSWPQRADIDTWRDWCCLDRSIRVAIARRATLPQARCHSHRL